VGLDERKGYVGGTAAYEDYNGNNGTLIGASGYSTDAAPDWSPNGEGYAIKNGWKQAGTSAYDADVDRARRMGAEGQQRGAVQLNQEKADYSRDLQMGALDLLQMQANGSAPSSAQILSQRANEGAVAQAGHAMTGAKGLGSRIAAFNGAAPAAAGQAMQANAQNAQMRAGEISRGQGSFATGANQVQGQDIAAATTNAQLEAQQRALNESRQQAFEGQAWGVRHTQQQAADDFRRQGQAGDNARHQQKLVEDAADDRQTDQAISTGMATGRLALSDERAKSRMHPVGSLSGLMRGSWR
jgi:hypothetical protein